MRKLTPDDLLSLEAYHKQRATLRAEVMEHKRPRQVGIGPNVTLYFEDRITMRYQVQEMLRAERIFEAEGIAGELAAYNPLIPDGTNLKATMMLEYPDVAERRDALARLGGIEHRVYVAVGKLGRVFAIADEDLPRSEADKTAAVHFLRFELDAAMCAALKSGAELRLGVDHDGYRYEQQGSRELVKSLSADID
jgi:Protein of unknown function (DUF3501)